MSSYGADIRSESDVYYEIFKRHGADKVINAARYEKLNENQVKQLLIEMKARKLVEESEQYEAIPPSNSLLHKDGDADCASGSSVEHPESSNLAGISHDTPNTKVHEDCYPIRSREKKGLVLILTNIFRNKKAKHGGSLERLGALKDTENMKELWTNIGCDIIGPKYDFTRKQMLQELDNMQSEQEGKYDFVVVVLSSHGGLHKNGSIYLFDDETFVSPVGDVKWFLDEANEGKGNQANNEDEADASTESGSGQSAGYNEGEDEVCYDVHMKPIRVSEILDKLNNANAANLRGIPKMFMFQFCRGAKHDKGVVQDVRPETRTETEEVRIARIPTMSDVLVAFPAHRGFAAWRNIKDGSWFMSNIYEVFSDFWKREHVVDMLTRVNEKMKTSYGYYRNASTGAESYDVKSMSKFESSLTKKFFLYPPK